MRLFVLFAQDPADSPRITYLFKQSLTAIPDKTPVGLWQRQRPLLQFTTSMLSPWQSSDTVRLLDRWGDKRWKQWELELLGTARDAELAARFGRTVNAVRVMRGRLGKPKPTR